MIFVVFFCNTNIILVWYSNQSLLAKKKGVTAILLYYYYVISVSATVKWELYKSARRSRSVGLSIHSDSFRAKNVANRCLHMMWVSDERTVYIKEGQVHEYGTFGAASRSRRIVYVAADPRTWYSV